MSSTTTDQMPTTMSSTEFDPRPALTELVKDYDNPAAVPRDLRSLGRVFLLYKRGRISEVTAEQHKLLACNLYNLANQEMTAQVALEWNAKNLLETITKPENKVPEIYRRIAESLQLEYAAINWGITEEVVVEAAAVRRSLKRPAPTQDGGPLAKRKPSRVYVPRRDEASHWGPGGVMHNIIKYKTEKTTYAITEEYKRVKPTAHNFGHNGLVVGACWPIMHCLLRDGAHGEAQGGITGTELSGCYSIVLGPYEENEDKGDVIYYSEPSAHNTAATNIDMKVKKGALALLKSLQARNPVRVIRKYTGNWVNVPRAGYRYDGLYVVVGYKERERKHASGKYKLFTLVRLGNQPAIDTSRPTSEERRIFEEVTRPME